MTEFAETGAGFLQDAEHGKRQQQQQQQQAQATDGNLFALMALAGETGAFKEGQGVQTVGENGEVQQADGGQRTSAVQKAGATAQGKTTPAALASRPGLAPGK